jgi:Arc/MetJ-type ribon-helix-helix transcriptional regulator
MSKDMKHVSVRLSEYDLEFIDGFTSRTEAIRLAIALLRMATENGQKLKKAREVF